MKIVHRTTEQLVTGVLRRLDWELGSSRARAPSTAADHDWRFLIITRPERAWPVFLEIARRRPVDDAVLERLWERLDFLLRRHRRAFHDRVAALVHGHARLRRIVPDGGLTPGFHRAPPIDVPALVRGCLLYDRSLWGHGRLDWAILDDAYRGLYLALAVIERGPLHGLSSAQTVDPLWELLRRHRWDVIDGIEAAAGHSPLVRRCLWRLRLTYWRTASRRSLPDLLWARLEAAEAGTTDYNSWAPVEEPLRFERASDEEAVEGWLGVAAGRPALDRVRDLVWKDPELGWRIIELLVQQSVGEPRTPIGPSDLVAQLLALHGPHFIERVEAFADRDARFRAFLALLVRLPYGRYEVPEEYQGRLRAAARVTELFDGE